MTDNESIDSVFAEQKQPRGRPPKGKIWVNGGWIDGVKTEKKKMPRGRPRKDKILKNGVLVIASATKLCFKKMTINGKTIFVKINRKVKILEELETPQTLGVCKPFSSLEANNCLVLNKKLHNLLLNGRKKGASEIINQGASFSYFNFEGICHAADTGNIAIFYDIFEKKSYMNLIDTDLGNDLMESATENGHIDLAELISHYSGNFLETIENQNLIGMNAFSG